MKKNNFVPFVTLLFFGMMPAQAYDQELVFKGNVKTLTLVTPNDSDRSKTLTTVYEYDLQKRKIRETSPYQYHTDYFYLTKSGDQPDLKQSYHRDYPKEQTIDITEKNKSGETLLSGDLKAGNWNYYYIHHYSPTTHTTQWFTDGEIYLETTEEKIKLSSYKIPSGFVPFEWDKNLSSGVIKKSKDYTADRNDHTLSFEFVEKNQPKNRITYHYNGPDVYDPGKGYWHRYENDKMVEERYIYNAREISDFGHRYVYNLQGKLVSDHYGYFSQMPNTFMQRNLYTYNEKGDCIKRTEDSDSGKTYITNYKYTYDDQHNWISQTSVYEDGSGRTIKRSFTYYKPGEAALKNSLSESIYNQYLTELRAYQPVAEKQLAHYNAAKSEKDNAPADPTNYSALRSKNWKDFLPPGQKLDTLATGDLNKDQLDDLVMVYQPEKLLKKENSPGRILRILLKQSNGQYQLAAESAGAVAGESMNNVYFTGMDIKKGLLIINHDFIRGGAVHKYRYQNGGFYLIGAESRTGDASYYSSIDYNLSTGKYIEVYENWDNHKDLPKSSKKEGVQKLQSLPDIETFELFSVSVGHHNL